MKTLTEQYRLIKEDKGHKGVFLKEAKAKYPNLLTNSSTFKEATTILKQKNIISENYIDLQPINNPIERKKEGFENAFANFLAEAEAKAEEKKVTKEVEETEEHNYDYEDKKDPNNMIFGQIQMGYYFEMKQEKNADKTIDEIKDIVFKNLAKDPIYYTKNGQFGVEVGYTEDNVSLGVPKEPKGEYKSSGYGKVEGESKFKYVVNENKEYFESSNSSSRNQFINWVKKTTKKEFNDLNQDNLMDLAVRWSKEDQFEFEDPFKDEKNVRAFVQATMMDDQNKLKESKKPINEIAIAGGLVTGGGFTSANYMDFYGLNEADDDAAEAKKIEDSFAKSQASVEKIAATKMFEEDELKENYEEQIADALSSQAEEILRAAEERGEELDIDKVLDKVFEMSSIRDLLKQHLEIFVRDLM